MKKEARRLFISDCEGPISKNDNAFELSMHFLPEGGKLFTLVSKYDDVLADIIKRPGYKTGDTLKLILPFFKAYGVTDAKMLEFSQKKLLLMPYAKETLAYIRDFMPSFIVSTSYEHYIKALCQAIGFPYENTYCTKLKLDGYSLTEKEAERLRKIAKEIAELPMIKFPENAKTIEDLHPTHKATIQRLDQIFWREIAEMNIGKILIEVNPIGGWEKAQAVEEIIQKHDMNLNDVMYVGDSITDVESFHLVRRGGGLTVSFNGNRYAVREAEVAVLAENTAVTAVLARVFHVYGKEKVVWLAENWNMETIRGLGVPAPIMERLLTAHPQRLPKVKIVNQQNMETIAMESSEFRKKVRGEAVGRLG